MMVWRAKVSRYEEQNMVQHDRWGGGSVMVWSAISMNHKAALIPINGTLNAQGYLQEILEPVAIPFGIAAVGTGFIFQDDNA